jgi:hypothetical protein
MISSETTLIEKTTNGKLRITIELDPREGSSFLEKEENLALLLNKVGLLATESLLKEYDVDQAVIQSESTRYYRKGEKKRGMRVLMGH